MDDESSRLPRVRRREEAANSFTTLRVVTKKRAMTDNGRWIRKSLIMVDPRSNKKQHE
ncbi:hypothetical protein X777_06774 [Ooceraea biroi]|uniref:Uncharacterized protein n=1 Tax=Ooceraea biroi TaxID=2015173 RepID=A0A026WC78_OOCBI|nr:hypothetical protein X777_06774 [Ooceraea biroi]